VAEVKIRVPTGWLLEGDPAIRWQALADLCGADLEAVACGHCAFWIGGHHLKGVLSPAD
jgi:hypothetical protein